MRKSLKMAAASTVAALAMVGGAASTAFAMGGPAEESTPKQVNYCGNSELSSEAEAERVGYAESDDVEANGQVNQTACVNGDDNFVANYSEGDVAGDDLNPQEEAENAQAQEAQPQAAQAK